MLFTKYEINNKYSKLNCEFYGNNHHYSCENTNANLNYAHFLDLLSSFSRYQVTIEPHIHPIRYQNNPGILVLLLRLLQQISIRYRLERNLTIPRTNYQTFPVGRMNSRFTFRIRKHIIHFIRQNITGFQNRNKLQAAGFYEAFRSQAAIAAVLAVDKVEHIKIIVFQFVDIAANLRPNDFALNCAILPIRMNVEEESKFIANIVFIGNNPINILVIKTLLCLRSLAYIARTYIKFIVLSVLTF